MRLFLLLPGLLFPFSVFSQILKGHIVDSKNEPVPAASVYIKENKQGLIANETGEFHAKLSPGTYHLEVRCMGYESENWAIEMTRQDLELTIVLQEKDFQLKEVEIKQGEDPAYEIMRRAIKAAPYYRSVVKESAFESYIKGSGKMTHIPGLINSLSKGDLEKYKDKLFMQESFSQIKFTAPDRYEQTVIAFSNTFPNMNDPQYALGIGMVSLYRPMFAGAVSPLHPKAFDYYRFRYEGYEEENDRIVNKIRIIPKLKDPKLMEGFICIADEEWNIRHAEITIHSVIGAEHITLNYHPVVKDIYLPTTYEMGMDMGFMGMKMEADFLASIQYTDIQLNDSLIAEHEKSRPAKKKKEKKSLEIKAEDFFKRTVDSLAVKRDSLYWSEVRTVLLNEEEQQSYARKDTMQALTDSISRAEDNPKFKASDLLSGGKLGNDSSLLYFNYSGLLGAVPEYNFVDGVWLGQSFGFDFKKKKNTGFRVNSEVYWASDRKTAIWKEEVLFDYAPRLLGRIDFRAGRTSEDFSGEAGMDRLLNSLYSLLGGKNYARFYDKAYLRIFNQIDIANGLQLGLGYEIARRRELENHTTWNLFCIKDKAGPNMPEYAQPVNPVSGRLSEYEIRLQYTPEYYYRIIKGKKRYEHSRFPTFELDYRQGFKLRSLSEENHSVFSRLEIGMEQEIDFGIFSRLNYRLIVGKFLTGNQFNYADYKHFNTSAQWFTFKDWDDSYVLLPYYTCSTNKEWLQVFLNYNTDYLFLKRLPFLQGKLFTETLQAKFLHTPDKNRYSEWGYSVHLPMGIGGAGLFVAFDSFDYSGFGVQLTLPLFNIVKKERRVTITIN